MTRILSSRDIYRFIDSNFKSSKVSTLEGKMVHEVMFTDGGALCILFADGAFAMVTCLGNMCCERTRISDIEGDIDAMTRKTISSVSAEDVCAPGLNEWAEHRRLILTAGDTTVSMLFSMESECGHSMTLDAILQDFGSIESFPLVVEGAPMPDLGIGGDVDATSGDARLRIYSADELPSSYAARGKRWTDEDRAALVDAWRRGDSVPAISEALGRSPHGLFAALARAGEIAEDHPYALPAAA